VTIEFLSIAESELEEAIIFYEQKEAGLGLRFLAEVQNSLLRIVDHPHAWYRLSPNTHRCRTRVFPYALVYQFQDSKIMVIAVASLHREPNYWKDRA
jgi:toxin ParE2